MTTLLLALHILVAVTLVGVVLVQRGEGADMGVSFGGGGAQTLFGSRGSGSFLGKLTGALAAVFMLTSLTLAFFSQRHAGSVVDQTANQPAQQQEAPLPAGDNGGAAPTFNPNALKANGAAPAPAKKPAEAPLPGAK
jgi:preprotein translocase subunit SecG